MGANQGCVTISLVITCHQIFLVAIFKGLQLMSLRHYVAARNDFIKDKFQIPLKLGHPKTKLFTGRKTVLDRLHDIITTGTTGSQDGTTKTIVIHGTGGMGKTQLVLEYISLHANLFSSVFWVNASSLETTQTCFISIAQQLLDHYATSLKDPIPSYPLIAQRLGMVSLVDQQGNIIMKHNTTSRIVEAVKAWLTLKGNDKWLVVFDNMDDLKSFNISEFFPSNSCGNFIITSRRPDCLRYVQYGCELRLDEMEEMESITLLSKCLHKTIEPAGLEGLLEVRALSLATMGR